MAPKYSAGLGLRAASIGLLMLATSPLLLAEPVPAWWALRGVTSSQLASDPTAAVNLGQLKQIASKARDELQASLAAGPGAEIDALIGGFGPNLTQLPGVVSSQSTTYPGAVSGRAIDNNTDGDFNHNSVSSTLDEASPWFQVDLGSSRTIQSVEIWNRTDCCLERTNNFYLFVSDTNMSSRSLGDLLADGTVWKSSKITAFPAPSRQFHLGNTAGRFVMVRIDATEQNKQFLSLGELKVRGINPSGLPDAGDYALVTSGQVKAISKLFYDRLAASGYPATYPWIGSGRPVDDTAVVNIGQLKKAFSFDITSDQDNDGIPNWWELKFGFNPQDSTDAENDADNDGYTNGEEFTESTDPRDPFNGSVPLLSIVDGNEQFAWADQFSHSPLIVQVTNSEGHPIANQTVVFSTPSNLLAANTLAPVAASLSTVTNGDGYAFAFFRQPTAANITTLIHVQTQGALPALSSSLDMSASSLGGNTTAGAAPADVRGKWIEGQDTEVEAYELTWRDTSNNETGFVIEKSIGDETNWIPVGVVPANTTHWNDYDLNFDDEIYYRVISVTL